MTYSDKLPIALVVGTRPEAIKLAPVVQLLTNSQKFRPVIISTGQHQDLLAMALADFHLVPDFELGVMTAGQTLAKASSLILDRLTSVIETLSPATVLVQGDTTTAFAGALAAYYQRIPLGHVEAGLRSNDLNHPFPEEANRQMIDRISRWCFAPTTTAAENIYRENIPANRVFVTGNTGIDALLQVLALVKTAKTAVPYVLVTLHRRESFGAPLREVTGGLHDFLEAVPNARAIWTMHPNPAIKNVIRDLTSTQERVTLLPPQNYGSFARLMAESRLILSDSGGVQEEAPSLGKTVLVARETSERQEALATGQNRLVGRTRAKVSAELQRAWYELAYTGSLPAPNPFGDGLASTRILNVLLEQV